METIEISNLELKINQLIDELEKIKAENNQLRQCLGADAKRLSELNAKNNQAAEKIKKVVRQLRESMS